MSASSATSSVSGVGILDPFIICALPRCINTENLKLCGACGNVWYCCKEHQVEHYKKVCGYILQ